MTTLLGLLSALVFLVVKGIKPPVQLDMQGGSQAKRRTALEAHGEKQDALVRRKPMAGGVQGSLQGCPATPTPPFTLASLPLGSQHQDTGCFLAYS